MNFRILALCVGFAAGLGCSSSPSGGGSEEDGVGEAQFAVKVVPNNVQCIQVTAAGSRTLTTSFNVAPNQSAQLSMPGLPAGSVTFSANAYSTPCSQVTASSIPGWSSAAVTAQVIAAGVIQLTLVMSQSGSANIGIEFGSAGAGGSAGSGGAAGLAGGGGGPTLLPGVWNSSNWDNALWQ